MNKLKGLMSWESGRRHTIARTTAMLAALVILAAYVATHQFAAVGHVELTATMGKFSPSLVKVGTSSTSVLTAGEPYNYNPSVPAPQEAFLVKTFTWSVVSVKKAKTRGGPYTSAKLGIDYRINRLPPTHSLVTLLTFKPKIARYWKVSVNCGVMVKDTKTGQKWSGSASAGPEKLTSYILHIEYNGKVVDNKTEKVCVGEKIPLRADVQPTDLGFQWNIMGTTVSNYLPTDSASNLKPVTAADLKSTPLTFYWVLPPQSNDNDVQLQLDGGGPSVFSTFDVYQPNQKMTATYVGSTYVNSNYEPSATWLYFGTAQGGDGVVFKTPVTAYPQQFGGKVDYVQTIGAETVTVSQYEGIFLGDQTWQSAMPPGAPPPLDTTFTYTKTGPYTNISGILWTDDGPGTPCSVSPVGFGSPYYESYLIIPTMYLIYHPKLAKAIWVPLDSYRWGWFGAAQKSEITGDWSVQNGENNPNPPVEVTPTGEPTWNTNILEYDKVWVLQ